MLLKLQRLFVIALLAVSSIAVVNADDVPVCAEVKIEILQELTLERQAFEATMRIHNDLDSYTLEDIK